MYLKCPNKAASAILIELQVLDSSTITIVQVQNIERAAVSAFVFSKLIVDWLMFTKRAAILFFFALLESAINEKLHSS